MQELELLFQTYKTTVFEKDLTGYAAIYDEDVVVFDMWDEWKYVGLRAWLQMVKVWFAGLGTDKEVVTFDVIQVHDNGDLAVLTAIIKFTGVSSSGEELRYLQNRLTWVARKTADGWKIIHQHTSSPIDFTTMKAILQQ